MPPSPRLAHKAPVMKVIRTVPRMSTVKPHPAEGKGKHDCAHLETPISVYR